MDSGTVRVTSPDQSRSLDDWEILAYRFIDELAKDPRHVEDLVKKLTSLTLPERPWEPLSSNDSLHVNPLKGELDFQFWFWNRAGNTLLDFGHPAAAAEIWSAAYLASLSIQQRYRQRYHKGMPLCNLGFAFARAGQPRWAIGSWFLGVVEDVLADGSTARGGANYRNLLQMKIISTVIDQMILTVESKFLDQFIIPMLPEAVIGLWLNPTMPAPSKDHFEHADRLMQHLTQSYPGLPNPASPWSDLRDYWEFSDWSERVASGR
jgi:hypothetical protein